MTTIPQENTPWGRILWETLKAAPAAWKVILTLITIVGSVMGLVGAKIVWVPTVEIARLAAQGMVHDTAINNLRTAGGATSWEVTRLRLQFQAAQRPVLVDLCLSRTYDQVMRMGLNCDSLGVVKRPPR